MTTSKNKVVKKILNILHNMSFMEKLVSSYIVVILIPLVIWSISSFSLSNAHNKEKAEIDFNNVSLYIMNSVKYKMDNVERSVQLISRDTSISNMINQKYINDYNKMFDIRNYFDPLINNMYASNPELLEFNIYTYGNIKGARESFFDIEKVSDENVLKQLKCGIEPLWLFDGNNITVSEKIIYIPDPLYSATISMKVDKSILFTGNFPDQSVDYRIIVTDTEEKLVYDLTVPALGEDFPRSLEKDMENTLFFSDKLSSNNWRVDILMDTTPLTSGLGDFLVNTAIPVALSLGLLLVLVALFSRIFVGRITKLNKKLAEVVPSNFTIDIHSDYKDEIGEITNSVGSMVKQTHDMITEVYEARLDRRDAQIGALQTQINPHFLYNTLSHLNWRAIKKDDHELSFILNSLSQFYRLSLNDGKKISTIGEELNHVRIYLKIQYEICKKDFTVEYDINPELETYLIPAIILQPIVENAIEHGIMPIGYENGVIKIGLYDNGDDLVIRISDNGPGISEEMFSAILTEGGKGYGFRNVDKRLKLFYDNKYNIHVEETIGGGTTVVIKLPKFE